jgi:PAS domain S-box-containing protein
MQMMAMILLMASVPMVIIAYSAHRQYLWELHDASHDAQRIAAEIKDSQNALVAGAEQLLKTLFQVEAVKTRDAAAVNRLLADLMKSNKNIANIMIIDPSGMPWASGVPMPNPPNVSDRRYFRQALTTGTLSSGEYAIGRLTGLPVLQFGYPIKDDTGKIHDIGLINFKLTEYGNFLKMKGVPTNTSLLLTDHKGTILFSATRPDLVGKQDREDLFRLMLNSQDEGTFEAVSNAGIHRLFAYEKVRLPGEEAPYLYVRVGVDLASVAAVSRYSLLVNSALLMTGTVLVLLLVYFTSRRGILDKVAALRDATEKVASGDLTVRVADRVSGGDLGKLGNAFDLMTNRLMQDTVERQQAECDLRESEIRFRTLIDQAGEGFELLDAEGRFIDVNQTTCLHVGYKKEELFGMSIFDIDPLLSRESYSATFRSLIGRPSMTFESLHRRKDGVTFPVAVTASIINLGGEQYALALVSDISVRKKAEDAVLKALAEKETLIRELYHRTKNNMQIVRSLMNLQASEAGDETRAIVKEVDNRIQGLALVHEMLYQSNDLSNLDLTAYLDTLVRAIARNFWGHHSPVIVDLAGEPLPVTLDIATPCGLVINELLSNTFKYAFPGGRHGVITVRISRDGPEFLLLEYADNGVGLPEGFDPRNQETLGMQSIFAIVEQQLQGEVRIDNADGLKWIMRIATGHYQERI